MTRDNLSDAFDAAYAGYGLDDVIADGLLANINRLPLKDGALMQWADLNADIARSQQHADAPPMLAITDYMLNSRRYDTAPCEYEPSDESMRTAAEEPGPLVLTGQGDYERGWTPQPIDWSKARHRCYRWLVGAFLAWAVWTFVFSETKWGF